MEKTLEFAINEALESGRRSAMPAFLEKELRFKISQEIESLYKNYEDDMCIDCGISPQSIVYKCADIAEGINETR